MRRDCLDQVTTIILKFSKILILEFVGQLLILFNSPLIWFRQCKFSIICGLTIHYTPHLIKCAIQELSYRKIMGIIKAICKDRRPCNVTTQVGLPKLEFHSAKTC